MDTTFEERLLPAAMEFVDVTQVNVLSAAIVAGEDDKRSIVDFLCALRSSWLANVGGLSDELCSVDRRFLMRIQFIEDRADVNWVARTGWP